MQPQDEKLAALAQRVREGDFQAKAQFKEGLESGLPYMVRRVLERGTAKTSLDEKILALAQQLAPAAGPGSNPPCPAPVSRELCRMVIAGLWPGHTEGPCQTTLTA